MLADYPAILRICQSVDGMPLGVELKSHLTPQQIQAVQAQAEGESYDQIVSQVLPGSH